MKDMKGFAFNIGCKVARAVGDGHLSICTVTDIKNGNIYLDNSKVAIRYPQRLLIIEQDPLYRMVKQYDNANNATS
jgi:hypothetical protein